MLPARRPTSALLLIASTLLCCAFTVRADGQQSAAAAEPDGFWTGDNDAALPATLQGGTVIHAQRLSALLTAGHAVVVDVSNSPRRPEGLAPGAPWLPAPHRTLPGALWIPGAGAGEITPVFDEFFRTRLAQAAGENLDRTIVVYCHERCWLSWNAAKRAIRYGYRHVYWFPEGIEGWTAAGLPTRVMKAEYSPRPSESAGPRASPNLSGAPPPQPRLAVLDIELTGDLGGPDLVAEHEALLKLESARLSYELQRTGLYLLLDLKPAQATIDRLKSRQLYLHDCNGCDLEIGRQLAADQILVAWVNRVSGLILTLTYETHEVASGQIAARKSYDFRGDNEVAWAHAIDYMVRDLKANP